MSQARSREWQDKPNRPKIGRSKANPVNQKKLKTQCLRSNETAVARGHHGRPVVFTKDRASPTPLFSSSSFAAVQFLARFSVLSCYLVLKKRVYLALLRGRIRSKLSLSLSKTPLKKKMVKEEGSSKRQCIGGELKDRHPSIA